MTSQAQLRKYALKMRNNPTKHEAQAIKLLSKTKIPYLNQVPFKYYILDFIITNRLLVVEIDGIQHQKNKEYDKRRDNFCKERGLKVLRINNPNTNTIIKKILKYPKIKGYKQKLKTILYESKH